GIAPAQVARIDRRTAAVVHRQHRSRNHQVGQVPHRGRGAAETGVRLGGRFGVNVGNRLQVITHGSLWSAQFLISFSDRSTTSNAARGRPIFSALVRICASRAGSANRASILYASVAMLFTLMAAPFSKRKSLLRYSWPGVGLTITMPAPRASTSEVVSP